jgi:hypothetical protein
MKECNGSFVWEASIAWAIINKTAPIFPSMAHHRLCLLSAYQLVNQDMPFLIENKQNKARKTSLIPYTQNAFWFLKNFSHFFVFFFIVVLGNHWYSQGKMLSSFCKWGNGDRERLSELCRPIQRPQKWSGVSCTFKSPGWCTQVPMICSLDGFVIKFFPTTNL